MSAPRTAAVALALLGACGALAETADKDKPTQVEANRMSADNTRRLNVFEGAVVLTKGTMRLEAERLIVRQDADGFQYASATGKPARFRQRQDPRPGEKEGIWVEGQAERVELDDCSTTRASAAAATRSPATTSWSTSAPTSTPCRPARARRRAASP